MRVRLGDGGPESDLREQLSMQKGSLTLGGSEVQPFFPQVVIVGDRVSGGQVRRVGQTPGGAYTCS